MEFASVICKFTQDLKKMQESMIEVHSVNEDMLTQAQEMMLKRNSGEFLRGLLPRATDPSEPGAGERGLTSSEEERSPSNSVPIAGKFSRSRRYY